MKGLEALGKITGTQNLTMYEQDECLKTIEKELKDYQEIKEIAKHFNWDNFTSEIFSVETDEKYRDLFNGAIVDIQKDYRKARAFEIIKKYISMNRAFKNLANKEALNLTLIEIKALIPDEEYNLLKEVLSDGKI